MPETPLMSATAARLLVPLVLNPHRVFFQREMERLTSMPLGSVQTALSRLLKDGVANTVVVGGRPGVQVVRDNLFYPELVRIAIKSIGIPEALDATVGKPSLKVRAVSVGVIGSFAKGDFGPGSDMDVLVIGDEARPGAADTALAHLSAMCGRELSCIVIGSDQYRRERDSMSGFIGSVLNDPVIILRGAL